MTTVAVMLVGMLLLAGAGALWRGAIRAPEGYEDELGFHRGVQAQPAGPEEAMVREIAEPHPAMTVPAVLVPADKGVPDHAYGTS